MNLGNSFTVREDEPCRDAAYIYTLYVRVWRGLLLFLLTTAFLGPISGD